MSVFVNKKVDLTSDATFTLYTVPSATTAIIKTAWVYNNSGGSAQLTLKINNTAIAYDGTVADKYTKSWFYLASGDIGILEAGDILKINTNAQPINVYVSLLEIS